MNKMDQEIKFARDFAIKHHADQLYGDKPYVYHLDMVYSLGCKYKVSKAILIASFLHDLIEDVPNTGKLIKDTFGIEIYNLVYAVSGFGETREEKKMNMIKKLEGFHDGIVLKQLDRLANMTVSSQDSEKKYNRYVKELDDYDKLFKTGNNELYEELMKFKTICHKNKTKYNI